MGFCPRCGAGNRQTGARCRACDTDPENPAASQPQPSRLPTAANQHWAVPDAVSTLLPHVAPHRRRAFWRALAAGTAALIAWGGLASADPDPALVSRLLVFGAFYVPVLFVFFMASEALVGEPPVVVLIEVFIGSALLANLAAVLLNGLLPFGDLSAGPIEEGVKFATVVWLLRRRSFPTLMDGILFGAAAGMGFAASENLNYFFSAYSNSGIQALLSATQHGLVHNLAQAKTDFQQAAVSRLFSILFWRSFFGPWLHGSWTAIIAGVAWREARGGRMRVDLRLLGAFLAVAALHSAWDAVPGHLELALFPVIVAVDVLALRGLIRAAHRQELEAPEPQDHDGEAIGSGAFHCPACGAAVGFGARFCSACGRSVADAVRLTAAGPRLGPTLRPVSPQAPAQPGG